MCLGLVTFLSAKTQMLKIYMFTPANPLSANMFDHFVILALEGLKSISGLTFY